MPAPLRPALDDLVHAGGDLVGDRDDQLVAVLQLALVAAWVPATGIPARAGAPALGLAAAAGADLLLVLSDRPDIGALLAVPGLGLLAAVLVYAVLVRRGVRRRWACLAVAPLVLDGYVIALEHYLLAESLFILQLAVAVALLLWRDRPGWALAGAAYAATAWRSLVRASEAASADGQYAEAARLLEQATRHQEREHGIHDRERHALLLLLVDAHRWAGDWAGVAATVDRAVEIAALPDMVRGYEDIKLANVARYRARLAELLG